IEQMLIHLVHIIKASLLLYTPHFLHRHKGVTIFSSLACRLLFLLLATYWLLCLPSGTRNGFFSVPTCSHASLSQCQAAFRVYEQMPLSHPASTTHSQTLQLVQVSDGFHV